MKAIFHDMMHKEMEDYVDDIVVKSKSKAGQGTFRYLNKFLKGVGSTNYV